MFTKKKKYKHQNAMRIWTKTQMMSLPVDMIMLIKPCRIQFSDHTAINIHCYALMQKKKSPHPLSFTQKGQLPIYYSHWLPIQPLVVLIGIDSSSLLIHSTPPQRPPARWWARPTDWCCCCSSISKSTDQPHWLLSREDLFDLSR